MAPDPHGGPFVSCAAGAIVFWILLHCSNSRALADAGFQNETTCPLPAAGPSCKPLTAQGRLPRRMASERANMRTSTANWAEFEGPSGFHIPQSTRWNRTTPAKKLLTILQRLLQTEGMHFFATLVLKSGLAPGRGWRVPERY
ncbi:hypothetical protein [Azohydromonas lata]|uniref:hypothetical protein n=1 Tax=Azohydromonas lata TaxID=45677 RepID=UPI0012F4B795|nr:hypothetical protein [Azohydromonas lata]